MIYSNFRRSSNIEDGRAGSGSIDPLRYYLGDNRAPMTLGYLETPVPAVGPTVASSFGLAMPPDSFAPYSQTGAGTDPMHRYLAQLLMRNSPPSWLIDQ